MRNLLIWAVVLAALLLPLILAAQSPLLAWREPVYIIGGFAGVVAMAFLLMQPLLVGGYLPGVAALRGRRGHRVVGSLLVMAVVVHVGALWITSPPDVIDVLLFRSPTPFAIWGVVAMWAVFATALLALMRRRLRVRAWRLGHGTLALMIVTGSVVHAVLIEGTMEVMSKVALCALVVLATMRVLGALWRRTVRRR